MAAVDPGEPQGASAIYVRHGFEPVLELPAVIREAGRPIGTHAFYAVESDGPERAWIAASLTTGIDAGASLDRIELPDEVAALLQTALGQDRRSSFLTSHPTRRRVPVRILLSC